MNLPPFPLLAGAALAALGLLSGCGGSDGSSTGTMRVSLTGAPACGCDHVFLTVEKVRALQQLKEGPWIEGAAAPVDSGSGHREFRLPIEPPVRTAHAANPPSLSFVPDSLVPGFYKIAARSTSATKPQTIHTQVAVPDLTFTFP